MAYGTSRTPMGQLQHAIGMERLAVANGGRTVEVYVTGESYAHGQVDEDPGVLMGIKHGLGVRSMLVVPMEVEGRRRGVVSACSAQPANFRAADLGFLHGVAHWMGLVLQRAELVERVAEQAAQQARQLVAEELVTMLAHDLGNYLTPLIGRVDLMRRRAEREARPTDVRDTELLAGGIARLQRMIADLLDVGRLEHGIMRLAWQPVNLTAVVQGMVDLLQGPGRVIETGAPAEVMVVADLNRIQQLLENVVTNAQKHSPAGVPVVIEVTQPEDEWVSVKVRDSGPGIAPELLPHLFTRFAAGPQSTGLGLGLFLAHSIAVAHGGTLTVELALGSGSTFELRLPVAHAV